LSKVNLTFGLIFLFSILKQKTRAITGQLNNIRKVLLIIEQRGNGDMFEGMNGFAWLQLLYL
jgi:hypothetical protein